MNTAVNTSDAVVVVVEMRDHSGSGENSDNPASVDRDCDDDKIGYGARVSRVWW
jgi:hypothetical protein